MENIAGFCGVRICCNVLDFMLATFFEGAFELVHLRALAKYMNYSYFVTCLNFFSSSANVRMNSGHLSFLHITHCFL